MTVYINCRTAEGVETFDEVTREDFQTGKEYKAEINNIINSYRLLGYAVYTSRKCTKYWKERTNIYAGK